MATLVTVRMFSGRPNPTYLLDGVEEAKFFDRVGDLPIAPPGAAPLQLIGGLGYRGFLLEPVKGTERTPMSLYGGMVDSPYARAVSRLDSGRALEYQLLRIILPALEGPVQALALKESRDLYAEPHCAKAPKSGTGSSLTGRPAYAPGPWNTVAAMGSNNCYNYATNKRFTTGTAATPGLGGGSPAVGNSCTSLTAAVGADGLTQLTGGAVTLPGTQGPVALFVKPGGLDHHFYRQDKSGLWSHKPGGWPVRHCDEAGISIQDPRTANTLDYVFCKFFKTGPGITIA